MQKNYLNVDYLRRNGTPQWFGLGFIQLKLTETTRLHFWHPSLKGGLSFEEELHDHRYDFTSTILKGALSTEIWSVHDGLGHEMYRVSCTPDSDQSPAFLRTCKPRLECTYQTGVGQSYSLPMDTFHRTSAETCITFLERGETVKEHARVIRSPREAMSCPFATTIPAEKLWATIDEMINGEAKPGYHLAKIEKGVLGDPSKILEETLEYMDAVAQDASIMALVELSDLVGAVEAYLKKHHPTMGLDDLRTMSEITARAFRNGRR